MKPLAVILVRPQQIFCDFVVLLCRISDCNTDISFFLQARAPDSVVIIVGTFYDQLSPQQKKSGFVERMHKLICQLYVGKDLNGGIGVPRERGLPRVVRVIDVSCTSGHHINILREMIYTTALEIKGPGKCAREYHVS